MHILGVSQYLTSNVWPVAYTGPALCRPGVLRLAKLKTGECVPVCSPELEAASSLDDPGAAGGGGSAAGAAEPLSRVRLRQRVRLYLDFLTGGASLSIPPTDTTSPNSVSSKPTTFELAGLNLAYQV
jgi:hypothetical protein